VAHLQRLMFVRPTTLRGVCFLPRNRSQAAAASGVCVLSPISLRWRRHREELESCGRRRPTRPSRTTTSSATSSNCSLLSSSSVAPRRTGVPGTKTLTPPSLADDFSIRSAGRRYVRPYYFEFISHVIPNRHFLYLAMPM